MKKKITKALSVMLAVVLTLTAAPLSGFVGLELPEWLDVSVEASAAELTKKDIGIINLVNYSKQSFTESANSLKQIAEEDYSLVKKIIVLSNVAEWTGNNLAFLWNFYDPTEIISVAANSTYQYFVNLIKVCVLNTGKVWVDEGTEYLDKMCSLYEEHADNQGKITDPNIAREIYKCRLYGGSMLLHGVGYWMPYIEKVVEDGGITEVLDRAFTEDLINREMTMNLPLGNTGIELYDLYCKIGEGSGGVIYGVLEYFEQMENISTFPFDKEKLDSLIKAFENTYTTASCYQTSNAYSNSKYFDSFRAVQLTGNQREDIVNVALSQVGYHEGNSINELKGLNIYGNKNYTEYAYWFGTEVKGNSYGHYYAWCAMFVSWCARQARIPISIINNAAYACADGSSRTGGYSNFHIDYYNKNSYTPQKGDIIFFGDWEHVGIVYKVENGEVYTVEGNNDNSVKIDRYSLNSPYIKCYGVPKYNQTNTTNLNNAIQYDYYNGSATYITGNYIVTATSGLNTRKGPSANSPKLSAYTFGEMIVVTAVEGNWGYTDKGWVCLDYTGFVTESNTSNNVQQHYNTGNYTVSTSAGLNCRTGPGTGYSVKTALTNKTQFSVTKTDGAWGYSPEYNGWLCLQYASYVSALTPSLPVPAAPALITSTSSEIGVNDTINVSWNAVDTATKYNVKVTDANTGNVVKSQTTTATKFAFKTTYAGVFNVSVSATNSQHTGETSTLYGFSVKAPLTVTFKNWDGSVISTQKVSYGKDAKAPATPTRTGYTFSKWNGDFTTVRENLTITAEYTRNKYTVTFCDYDGTVVDTQDVYYGDAAEAPDYEAPTGYSFVKWDKSFSKITGNLTIKAVVSWTSIYPLEISTKSAVQRNNTSYIVTSIVNNSPNAVSNAKIIAVLKTAENKLLATVVSDNLTLAAGEVKNLTLTAEYDGMATKAELFVVKADDQNIPLASQLAVTVDQGTAWSSWSTSTPPSDAVQVESRTEYRYRDKSFKTSSSSTLSGYTQYDHTYKWGSWSSWSAWQDSKVSAITSESVETQRKVKTQTVDDTSSPIYETTYNYYRYASTNADTGGTGWYEYNSNHPYYRTYQFDSKLTEYDNDYSKTRYHYWHSSSNWVGVYECNPCKQTEIIDYNQKTQYSYSTRSKIHTYYFYKWGSWSDWGTTAYSATDDRQVQTRTVYRYLANTNSNIETTEGVKRTISGNVGTAYSGRQALLFISSQDGTTQYLGQTKTSSSGAYSFTFKLMSEPTIESGDYNVTLSVEGTTAAIVLDPIEAPVPEYNVSFVDYDGTIISEQTIKKGNDASVPTSPTREGYKFTGWDKSSVNIQSDAIITAQYEIKSYDVVFVDTLNNTTTTKVFNHGDALVVPENAVSEDYNFLGWDAVIDGITTVTENMVVTTQYEKKTYTVEFYDYDGSLLDSQTVEHGDMISEPIIINKDGYVFISWDYTGDFKYITENISANPIYEYEQTVVAPVANITSGEFSESVLVSLSSETEGAEIYYTLDGTVPKVNSDSFKAEKTEYDEMPTSNGILYTEPFEMDSSTNLIFVAVKPGMNNSEFVEETYAINSTSQNQKHIIEIHNNINDNVEMYLADNGKTFDIPNMDLEENGYTLEGVYKDSSYTDKWSKDDVVTGSTKA